MNRKATGKRWTYFGSVLAGIVATYALGVYRNHLYDSNPDYPQFYLLQRLHYAVFWTTAVLISGGGVWWLLQRLYRNRR